MLACVFNYIILSLQLQNTSNNASSCFVYSNIKELMPWHNETDNII